jgi:hypothetical protein
MIESSGPHDIYEGRSHGENLCRMLRLSGIEVEFRLAVNREQFFRALTELYNRTLQQSPQPVLHLTAHGNNDGIALTSGEHISWAELGDLLIPINMSCGSRLFVAMSTCDGFNGYRMAMRLLLKPYCTLLGPSQSVSWSDAAIGFATFYHLCGKDVAIPEAVSAMGLASGYPHSCCPTRRKPKKTS